VMTINHVASLDLSKGQYGRFLMWPDRTLPNTKTTNKEYVSILPAKRGREDRP
jgi:hypothetical protein